MVSSWYKELTAGPPKPVLFSAPWGTNKQESVKSGAQAHKVTHTHLLFYSLWCMNYTIGNLYICMCIYICICKVLYIQSYYTANLSDRHDLTVNTFVTTVQDNNNPIYTVGSLHGETGLGIVTPVNLLYVSFFSSPFLARDIWGWTVLYYLIYCSLPSCDLQKKPNQIWLDGIYVKNMTAEHNWLGGKEGGGVRLRVRT